MNPDFVAVTFGVWISAGDFRKWRREMAVNDYLKNPFIMKKENLKKVSTQCEQKTYDFAADYWWNVFQALVFAVAMIVVLLLYIFD